MRTSTIIILACLLLLSFKGLNGQSTYCGSSAAQQHLYQTLPAQEAIQRKLEKQLYHNLQENNTNQKAIYTLPVVFHIVHNGGPENISDQRVLKSLDDLNDAFENIGFFDQGTGVDTEIEFCIATQDPDGDATTGIIRFQSPLTSIVLEQGDGPLKSLSRWDQTQYINVWIIRSIESLTAGSGVVGYAYLPSSHGNPEDGIVIEADYMGNLSEESSVLVHEMGHYLGLYHTFESGCANDDCMLDGDQVCDTAPDQSTARVPCDLPNNTCDTDVNTADPNNPFTSDVEDMIHNYMDYSDLECYSAFTVGQAQRMHGFIDGARSSLLDSRACIPACTNGLTASFVGWDETFDIGTTRNYSSSSQNATSFEWYINGVLVSNDQDLNYTFNDLGDFEVLLVTFNNDPNCREEFSIMVEVLCNTTSAFQISESLINIGGSIVYTNNSINADDYSWTLDGVEQSTAEDYFSTYDDFGVFEVCLTANGPLCTDQSCFFITVLPEEDLCNGQTWIKTYSESEINIEGHSLCASNDGTFFVGGNYGEQALLVNLDPTGAILWSIGLDLSTSLTHFIKDMKIDSDGMLIACGSSALGMSSQGFAFRFNTATREVEWLFREIDLNKPYRFNNITEINDSYFITGDNDNNNGQGSGCDAFLVQIDKLTGTPNGASQNFQLGSCESFQSAKFYDNRLYVCGRYNHAGGGTNKMRPSVSCFDLDGQLLWSRSYLVNIDNNARLYNPDLIIQNDEIIMVINGDRSGTGTMFDHAFLCKTDLDGNVIWAHQYNHESSSFILFTEIISLPDGYAVFGMDRQKSESFILKVDFNGVTQWSNSYNLPDGIFSASAARNMILSQVYFYFTAWTPTVTNNNNLVIAKVDFQNGLIGNSCAENKPIDWSIIELANPYDGTLQLLDYDVNFQGANADAIYNDVSLTDVEICSPGGPDASLFVNEVVCMMDSMLVKLLVCNNGGKNMPMNTPISFYQGDPTSSAATLITTILQLPMELGIGDCIELELLIPSYVSEDIYIVINDDGTITPPFDLDVDFPNTDIFECTFDNNLVQFRKDANVPTLDLGPDITVCDNGVFGLDAGPDFVEYEWNDNSKEQKLTVFEPGVYWVKASTACAAVYDTIEIILDEASRIDLGDDLSICPGDTVFLDAGPGFDQYNWYPNGNVDCDTCQSVMIILDSLISHSVVGINSSGCISIDTIDFNFDTKMSFDTIPICFGDSTVVFGQTVFGNGTYVDTILASAQCTEVEYITVEEKAEIEIQFESFDLCSLEEYGSITAQIMGGSPDYKYEWLGYTNDTPTLNDVPVGTYQLIVTDQLGCSHMANYEIKLTNPPDLSLTANDVDCFNSTEGYLEISTSNNDLSFALDSVNFSSELLFNGLAPDDYNLYVLDSFGCVTTYDFTINAPDSIYLSLPPDTTINLGDSILIESTAFAEWALMYQWDPPIQLDCDDCPDVTSMPFETTNYTLTVIDENGCTQTEEITIRVEKDLRVYTPNIINPNSLKGNDRFTIYGNRALGMILELKIYDRWGNLVFDENNFKPNDNRLGWDGRFNGKECRPGVFAFITKLQFIDGEEQVISGDLTLLR